MYIYMEDRELMKEVVLKYYLSTQDVYDLQFAEKQVDNMDDRLLVSEYKEARANLDFILQDEKNVDVIAAIRDFVKEDKYELAK